MLAVSMLDVRDKTYVQLRTKSLNHSHLARSTQDTHFAQGSTSDEDDHILESQEQQQQRREENIKALVSGR